MREAWTKFWSKRFNKYVHLTFHLYERMDVRMITLNMVKKAVDHGYLIVDDIDKDGEPRKVYLLEGVAVVLHDEYNGRPLRVITTYYRLD